MSTKQPERIPFQHFHFQFRAVGLMIENGWTVVSRCEVQLQMSVDLALTVKVKGPDATLCNRGQRCKKVGCSGWVYFLGKHPRRIGFDALKIDEKAPL